MARLAGQLKNERSRATAHPCLEPPPWCGAASVPAVIAPLRIPTGRRRTIVGLQKSPQGDIRRPASALCLPTTWIDDKMRNKSRTGIVVRVLAVAFVIVGAFVIAGARGGRGRRIERDHHLGASTGRSRPPADRTGYRRDATQPGPDSVGRRSMRPLPLPYHPLPARIRTVALRRLGSRVGIRFRVHGPCPSLQDTRHRPASRRTVALPSGSGDSGNISAARWLRHQERCSRSGPTACSSAVICQNARCDKAPCRCSTARQ